jgi:hypothetical protein
MKLKESSMTSGQALYPCIAYAGAFQLLGDYNSYGVLAYIPDVISWIFPLTN